DSKLVAYNSIHEALMAVSVGDVDTYIGDTGQISYYSSKLNITNLKVHESTSFKYDLRFGVTNDNEILRGILDKTLAKIDEKQREIIKDHWIHLDEDNIFTQKQRRVIGFSFIAVLLILFFIFYWNRVLKHRVSEKTAELNALNQVLEERVKERTESLSKANDALESSMEELLTTQEKLLEAQRYSVIGELLVGIAHELNTPIGNSFISTSHLQKETNKLMENVVANKVSVQEVADYIELALQSHEAVLCNLNRVTNIINRFKDLESSKWSGKKFELELGTLISDIIEHVSNLDKQLETYDIMLVGADVKIVSYPSWYREIFGALFLNTLSHGYDGKAGGRIVIKIAEEDRRIVIVYEDYGKGIEKEVQEKVFQPFFSTGKKTKHMGLGLPIIYNLITREMGGEIRLESEAGKYTRISIVVPKY
ncbi:MAG: transporter substrate-binding domain-containing protein, partial [Clostridia bacterium]|nr:transporter substrate-binding domain-containing protein [Clostridia bacterium]